MNSSTVNKSTKDYLLFRRPTLCDLEVATFDMYLYPADLAK